MGLNILHLLQELEGTYAVNDSASSRDANYETTHFILKSRNIGAHEFELCPSAVHS